MIFRNYITKKTPSCDIFLYADDSKIYKSVRTEDDQQNLQSVIDIVKKWSDEWLLKLNIEKCKSVSYYLNTPIETHYHIEKDQLFPLKKVKSVVDVGVRFDSKLTFSDHIS